VRKRTSSTPIDSSLIESEIIQVLPAIYSMRN
jgi:hypothetical protein